MKRTLIYTLIIAVAVVFSSVMYAAVVGSAHDFSTGGGAAVTDANLDWVCVFCHTPHQAAAANGQYPLWNHTLSATANYGTYTSATMDDTDIADIGGAAAGAASVSNLCMSCHDGTVAIGSLYNQPNHQAATVPALGAVSANLGTDLTDDHQIGRASCRERV